jgi:membrane-associated phospholipid phosphatase
VAFVVLTAAFVLLTLSIIYRSPVLHLDHEIAALHLRHRWPGAFWSIHTYVMLGQRGPSTLALLPWFIWRAWRERSPRPLVLLTVALLVLNVSVGVVKIATGRLGPRSTPFVHAVFDGGNIYPSGHVSNAVVLYGVLAMVVVRHRKAVIAAAAFISLTVGLSTIYLNTHWFSDVLGGWIAGGLVLLALPTLMPPAERGLAAGRRWWQRRQPTASSRPRTRGVRTGAGARTAQLRALPLTLMPY